MDEIALIDSPTAVEAALHHPDLVPPPAPDTLGTGPTYRLREAMARFCGDRDEHARRRSVIDRALTRIDVDRLAERVPPLVGELIPATEEATRDQVAAVVTLAMAAELGVEPLDDDRRRALVEDVRAVVEAIGRGGSADGGTDRATDRLLARFESFPEGPMAAVSLLYQNHDATAALIHELLKADAAGRPRGPAVRRTVRRATVPTIADEALIPAGSDVALDLEAAGLEFGAGPHRCPGRGPAEALATAVVAGLIGAAPTG